MKPISHDQILSGAFSFCFPGLGQLYCSRPFVTFTFFAAFIFCELTPQYHSLLPLVAIVASLEAYIKYRPIKNVSRTRTYFFASVATLALTYWFFLFAPIVIPM